MKKVLITGASGLTGSHIAEYFQKHDISCIGLVKDSNKAGCLKELGIEIRIADILNKKQLSDTVQDVNLIIHTAAKVGDWGSYDDFYMTNVIGTLNILNCALENGIKDIIITGSISCYGEESSTTVKDENSPYNSHYKYFLDCLIPSGMNFYRDTKALACKKAIVFAKNNNLNLTIIHPGWIFGEREVNSGFCEFLENLLSGKRIFPGSFTNKFHTIYVRDLAKIYYKAIQKDLVGINEFLAVSPKAELQHRIFDLLCEKAGSNKPIRLPKFIFYIPALLIEFIYILLGSTSPPLLTRARVNMFYDNIEYSSEKVRKVLDFEPDYDLEAGIERTVNWFQTDMKNIHSEIKK